MDPLIITVSAGFSAAISAQYLSHYLSRRRETEKYNKERYQKLYAPILNDVMSFLQVSVEMNKSEVGFYKINIDELREHCVKHIEQNIMYASAYLINLHQFIKRTWNLNLINNYDTILSVKLFHAFLYDLYTMLGTTDLFDRRSKEVLFRYIFIYFMWNWLIESRVEPEKALEIIKACDLQDEKLTKEKYSKLFRQKRNFPRHEYYEDQRIKDLIGIVISNVKKRHYIITRLAEKEIV